MTRAALSYPSSRLHVALEPWCAVGATGALRLLDAPGGAVYLTDGRISYAECPPACGLDRLLTASGRLSAEAWRGALAAGRADRRVGETLVRNGLLGPAELESLVLSALYGAAHFLFDLDSGSRFEMGVGHVIGQVVTLDLRTVCAELDRRRRVLDDTWPDSKLDSHAVLPARRFPGHHVTLTGLQWEIVANADRRRTPIELARSLGRDTFATLLEVRRLARAGLVEPGRQGTAPLSGAVTPRHREIPPGEEPRTERTGAYGRDQDASDPGRNDSHPNGSDPNGSDPNGSDPNGSDPAGSDPAGSDPAGSDPAGSDGPPGLAAAGAGAIEPPPDAGDAAEPGNGAVLPARRAARELAPLPRRETNDRPWLPDRQAARPEPPPPEELCPESTLLRIRDALEALR